MQSTGAEPAIEIRVPDGTVSLPRFQMETGFDVRAALEGPGGKRAFETLAAFQPIVPLDGPGLENAIQKTRLKVDEHGTEAVSLGMVGGGVGGMAGGVMGADRYRRCRSK
jgi:serine protease inhibitor